MVVKRATVSHLVEWNPELPGEHAERVGVDAGDDAAAELNGGLVPAEMSGVDAAAGAGAALEDEHAEAESEQLGAAARPARPAPTMSTDGRGAAAHRVVGRGERGGDAEVDVASWARNPCATATRLS